MKKNILITLLILLASCVQKNEKSKNSIKIEKTKQKQNVIINSVNIKNNDTIIDKIIEQTNLNEIIPKNYTELKESPANGRKMNKVIADLDNDKKTDISFIVQNENEFANYLLIIYLTSQKKVYYFNLIDNFEMDFNLFPVQLKINKNVLEVGYFRDGTDAFGRFLKLRFDETEKNIKLIGYDSGYRIITGHCHKTYNLINGNYTVNLQKSFPNFHIEKFKGNEKIEDIYIDEINIEILNKLDKIGSKYEPE